MKFGEPSNPDCLAPSSVSFTGAECSPHLFGHGVKKWTTNQIRSLPLKLLGISHRKLRFRIVCPEPWIVGFPTLEFRSFRIIRRRYLNRLIRRFIMLQLLLKKLVLKPHIFQSAVASDVVVRLVGSVAPVVVEAVLLCCCSQLLLLKFLLITPALTQRRTRQSSTWICLLGANRRRKGQGQCKQCIAILVATTSIASAPLRAAQAGRRRGLVRLIESTQRSRTAW